MNSISEFNCYACNERYEYYNINKHLETCEKYNIWIKTYIPPKNLECNTCKLNFINNTIFENHKINCNNK